MTPGVAADPRKKDDRTTRPEVERWQVQKPSVCRRFVFAGNCPDSHPAEIPRYQTPMYRENYPRGLATTFDRRCSARLVGEQAMPQQFDCGCLRARRMRTKTAPPAAMAETAAAARAAISQILRSDWLRGFNGTTRSSF